MSLDLGSYLDVFGTSATPVPPALLALIFLVTPTAIWIAYRLMFGRSGKRMPKSTIAYLWGCPVCHSANQPADRTCYGCGSAIDRFATVTLIDAVTMQVVASLDIATMTPSADAAVEAKPMVSVGPGRPDPGVIPTGPSAAPEPAPAPAHATAPAVPAHVPEQRPMTAVGARRPD
jgi:hypothetical protein